MAPLVTAVFGLLLAGLVINLLTRALQDRRTANQLKYDLLGQITEVASTLFHYAGELDELRKELLARHATGRTQTDVLEARLAAYFEEPRVAIAWHAVRDCLTVRVYNAIGGPEKLLREVITENSTGWESRYHTGLAESELTDSYKVWKAYDCHLKTTTKLVLACPLRPHKITRRARLAIDRALDAAEALGFDYKESNEG